MRIPSGCWLCWIGRARSTSKITDVIPSRRCREDSAPWYMGILLSAGVTAALVLVLLVILAVLKKKPGMKAEKSEGR